MVTNPLYMAPYLYGQHRAREMLPIVYTYYLALYEKNPTLAKHMIESTMEAEAFPLDREKYSEEYKQFVEEYITGFLEVSKDK